MKKIMTFITCALIVISGLFVMNDNQILAANLSDTFTQGDFEYKITEVATTSHGKVTIAAYDYNSSTTDLRIPNTVNYEGETYDVVSIENGIFEDAMNVESLHIPENLVGFSFSNIRGADFIGIDLVNMTYVSSLKTITVDENNPTLKVMDGVLYDVTTGAESIVLYPWDANITHYRAPEFLNSRRTEVYIEKIVSFAFHLESIEVPFNNDYVFTDKGIAYVWKDRSDHTQGSSLLGVPAAMKHPVFAAHMVDYDNSFLEFCYSYQNKALDFSFEDDTYFHAIDGNFCEGNQLLLYPGGRSNSIYKIPDGVEIIGRDAPYNTLAFLANKSLKTIILPLGVTQIKENGLSSTTLKSVMINGAGNISWGRDSLSLGRGGDMYTHVYYDNGNTTIKPQMQRDFSHLTDEYFHELGAVPTATVTEVKTSLENKKNVKMTWKSNESNVNYEVRRYDVNGEYKVVGSTTDTSFVDKTTAYNTTYKYEVVPYSLPLPSSNDVEDPLYDYHTFGTSSDKSEIKTPIQTFEGTYVYKDANGTEKRLIKDIQLGDSALNNAPTLPKVEGYEFEKWVTDLQDIDQVNQDFTITAIYKKLDDTQTPTNPSYPETPDNTNKPNISNKPDVSVTPEKPNDSENIQPSDKKDETVMTGDETNVFVPIISLLTVAVVMVTTLRKKNNEI